MDLLRQKYNIVTSSRMVVEVPEDGIMFLGTSGISARHSNMHIWTILVKLGTIKVLVIDAHSILLSYEILRWEQHYRHSIGP